jgi:hypothetical protein
MQHDSKVFWSYMFLLLNRSTWGRFSAGDRDSVCPLGRRNKVSLYLDTCRKIGESNWTGSLWNSFWLTC